MRYKPLILLFCSLAPALAAWPQAIAAASSPDLPAGLSPMATRLAAAVQKLEADPSMRHAVLGCFVVEAATGKIVCERNAELGLAPASCQKLFTSAAVLDMLGPDYRYTTRLGYDGRIDNGEVKGNLYLVGCGDPTLGSWRWDSTKEEAVLDRWVRAVRLAGIRQYSGNLIVDDSRWGTDAVPRGWIWEDIGNYYGAGAWGLNWHENQYDIHLQSGKDVGDPVRVLDTGSDIVPEGWVNELTTAPPGIGDNAFIFLPPYGAIAFLRGTIPQQKTDMVISGSLTMPGRFAGIKLRDKLAKEGIRTGGNVKIALEFRLKNDSMTRPSLFIGETVSPRLDSINYWFLKKSINLYGEALIKTLALEKTGIATTEQGTDLVKEFWAQRGIDRSAIHIIDGSGLSPQNRVTPNALVRVLQYAKTRPWYASFYQAIPVINGMHMKSGAIGGARSYAGYQVAADGKEYVFSIIVNNYEGSSAAVVQKLFGILNIMK
jgi:serine-type D-Ala-D-Ala carboxypeptidase/endopeptidase (penicillin-binding protein 4)